MNANISPQELEQLLHDCGTGKCSDVCPYVNSAPDGSPLSCGDKMMQDAAEMIEALQQELNEIRYNAFGWTDPGVQPPPEGIVLLVTDGRMVDSGIYDADTAQFDVYHAFLDPNDVIGWRPWPEA